MVCGHCLQSPVEIKRREVSWTLTKLDSHLRVQARSEEGGGAGPQVSPEEIIFFKQGGGAGPRKLDFFCFSCYSASVLRTLSL